MDENTQQKVDTQRLWDEEKAELIRIGHRTAVYNFWKIICTLCTVIGILVGYLISNMTFMGQIIELRANQESLQSQITRNTALIGQLMDMHITR